MIVSPFLRKLTLTAHISSSVGWFGAVAGFLVLAITGLISSDSQLVRSTYITMELLGWYVIIPFCIASFLTGLTESLGTPWGLFKHYWVLIKFLLTVIGTVILFVHMQPISYLAEIASKVTLTSSELRGLRIQLIADAGAALLVLLITTTLSVFKPWGRTRYGLRKQYELLYKAVPKTAATKKWLLYLLLGLIFLVILSFIILHFSKAGFNH